MTYVAAYLWFVEANASSDSTITRLTSKQWFVRSWKFKPGVTLEFSIPIKYQRQA